MHLAQFYDKLDGGQVSCSLCPHKCLISKGHYGTCGVRQNVDGELIAETYGVLSALAVDPIEKKPLYHFYPGSEIFSIGSYGCNFSCKFCQNAHISQQKRRGSTSEILSVHKILDRAVAEDLSMIAYTYNEPVVYYEMMLECAIEAKNRGLLNVMVSNGYINSDPLKRLLPFMDAFNIDLKAFTEKFYKEVARGDLQPVLSAIEMIRKSGMHLEITYLVIPGLNDTIEDFSAAVNWIERSCGKDQVLHLSKYFPRYKLNIEPTPASVILEMTDIAREKLTFVYPGNTVTEMYSNTYCSHCGDLTIERTMYNVSAFYKPGGYCNNCGAKMNGVFN